MSYGTRQGEFVADNTLSVYIKRLREKIEDDRQAAPDFDRSGHRIPVGRRICCAIKKSAFFSR